LTCRCCILCLFLSEITLTLSSARLHPLQPTAVRGPAAFRAGQSEWLETRRAKSSKVLKYPPTSPNPTQPSPTGALNSPTTSASLQDPCHVPFGGLTTVRQQHDGQNTHRISCWHCSRCRVPEKEGTCTPPSWSKVTAIAWQCPSAEREVHVEAGCRLVQRLWYARPRFSVFISCE